MSLADLYRDGASLSDDDDGGAFAPGEEDEASASGSEEGSDEDSDEDSDQGPGQEPGQGPAEGEAKRPADGAEAEADGPRKSARIASRSSAVPRPSTRPSAQPKRRASKFSKLAEQVEQRRAKKANTLDAARSAWAGFVAEAGIRGELDRANKDGYIERQAFLGRVDQRTFERTRPPARK
ncbi:swr complex subunit [Coemansia javaensis]|uniref:SWR1-complex protein 5 n=1 Tax=Coemansia javaensis TaxID=2761396 RepID=A0A9W8HED2_9FUNG|nr:swr complex subunit [Coemansia javaensis]